MDGPRLLRRAAELPQRLFLSVVSAVVLVALTIAAGGIWLSAWRLRGGR